METRRSKEADRQVENCRSGIRMAKSIVGRPYAPPEAKEFARSVARKLRDIGRTMRDARSSTPNQARAIRNMREGLQDWWNGIQRRKAEKK